MITEWDDSNCHNLWGGVYRKCESENCFHLRGNNTQCNPPSLFEKPRRRNNFSCSIFLIKTNTKQWSSDYSAFHVVLVLHLLTVSQTQSPKQKWRENGLLLFGTLLFVYMLKHFGVNACKNGGHACKSCGCHKPILSERLGIRWRQTCAESVSLAFMHITGVLVTFAPFSCLFWQLSTTFWHQLHCVWYSFMACWQQPFSHLLLMVECV